MLKELLRFPGTPGAASLSAIIRVQHESSSCMPGPYSSIVGISHDTDLSE